MLNFSPTVVVFGGPKQCVTFSLFLHSSHLGGQFKQKQSKGATRFSPILAKFSFVFTKRKRQMLIYLCISGTGKFLLDDHLFSNFFKLRQQQRRGTNEQDLYLHLMPSLQL